MKYLLCVILALSTLSSCTREEIKKEYKSFITQGDTVPKFTITSTEGDIFNSQNINKYTLIYFFWSECPDCSNTTKEVMELWKESVHNDNEVELISISRVDVENTSIDKIAEYWNHMFKKIYPIETPDLFIDQNRTVFNRFAEAGVPRFYLTNKDGVVVWQSQSPLTTKAEILIQIDNVKKMI